MSTRIQSSLLAVCALLFAALIPPAVMQSRPKIPPPDFKREVVEDEAGLRQWKPFDVECDNCKGAKKQACEHCKTHEIKIECLECKNEKRAPCRPCGAKGKMPDPLLEMACPYCWGSTWYNCGLCNSFGMLLVGNEETKCGACKQKGLLACIACDGKRRVDTVRLGKKNVGEASASDLEALLVKLRESLAAMEAFEPDANPSKSLKAFSKPLEPIQRELKVAKEAPKMLDEVLKGVRSYGAGYSSYEDRLLNQFLIFKDRTVFLLQHQIRAAEQALERAQFNEAK